MSYRVSVVAVVTLLIGVSIPSLAAQASKKAEKSMESMRKTRQEIEKAKVQKDKTMAALESLIAQSGKNLKKPYDKFKKELKNLDKSAEKVRKVATDMRTKSQDLYKVWEKELTNIQNPDLQQKAGQRREQAMEQFGELEPVFQSTRTSFVSLMATLEDIRNYLGVDLSPSGIEAISEIAGDAKAQNQGVDDGLAEITKRLDEFAKEFSGGR